MYFNGFGKRMLVGAVCMIVTVMMGCEKSNGKETSEAGTGGGETGAAEMSPASQGRAADMAAQSVPSVEPANDVAVYVNEEKITEQQVDQMIMGMMRPQMQGRNFPPEQLEQFKNFYRQRALVTLIDAELMNQQVEEAGTTAEDEELQAKAEQMLTMQIFASGQSREEIEAQMQQRAGMGLDEMVVRVKNNPMFQQTYLYEKYVKEQYPEETKVTAEDMKEYYEENKSEAFTRAPEVRASHILFGTMDPQTRQPKSEEEAAEAKEKAEDVLEQIRNSEGEVDFAALAKENSSCPSSAKGGDLGYFPRQGAMVEPFAAAAFEMEVGEISDLVETQFGYHIIKVTDRKEGKTLAYDEVKDVIEAQLIAQKVDTAKNELLKELHKEATYEYPEGKSGPKPGQDSAGQGPSMQIQRRMSQEEENAGTGAAEGGAADNGEKPEQTEPREAGAAGGDASDDGSGEDVVEE